MQSRSSDDLRLLARYVAVALAVVGGLEWLLGRTVSRLASSPVLEGTARDVVERLGGFGIFLLSPAFVLAAVVMLFAVIPSGARASAANDRPALALALYLGLFCLFTAALTLVGFTMREELSGSWVTISFNILSALAVWWPTIRFAANRRNSLSMRLGAVLVALGYTGWYAYVLKEKAFPSTGGGETWSILLLNLGEIAAVAAPVAFFAATAVPNGQWKRAARWVLPVLVTLAFSAGNVADMVANQGFTGVFAIWSLGLNLFLPWPLYAVSLCLYLYAVLTCFSASTGKADVASGNTGLGLLLLLFAGYSLQLTYQHLLAVLAILLLTGVAAPFAAGEEAPETRYGDATGAGGAKSLDAGVQPGRPAR